MSEEEIKVAAEPESVEQLPEDKQKDPEALSEMNKRLFARAKKAEQDYRELKAKAPTPVEPKVNAQDENELRPIVTKLAEVENKREFADTHGFNRKEVDFIFASAKGLGLAPEAAKDNPFIKAAVEAQRAQTRAESATPSPSSRFNSVTGTSFSSLKKDDRKSAFNRMVGKE